MAAPAYGARYLSGAEADAVAATTIVYSMAPYSSSFCTTCVTVEAFWPMAT